MQRCTAVLIAGLWASLALAQTPYTSSLSVSLPQVADLVMERNLEVQAAWKGPEAAGHVLKQVQALRRGKASIHAEYMHLNDVVAINSSISLPFGIVVKIPPVEVAPQDRVHLRLQAGYPLSTGGKIQAAIEQACVEAGCQPDR